MNKNEILNLNLFEDDEAQDTSDFKSSLAYKEKNKTVKA